MIAFFDLGSRKADMLPPGPQKTIDGEHSVVEFAENEFQIHSDKLFRGVYRSSKRAGAKVKSAKRAHELCQKSEQDASSCHIRINRGQRR